MTSQSVCSRNQKQNEEEREMGRNKMFSIVFLTLTIVASVWADFRKESDLFDSFRFGKIRFNSLCMLTKPTRICLFTRKLNFNFI